MSRTDRVPPTALLGAELSFSVFTAFSSETFEPPLKTSK